MTGSASLRTLRPTSVTSVTPTTVPSTSVSPWGRSGPDAVRTSLLELVERFRPHEAAGLDVRWSIEVVGHRPYTIHIRGDHCMVSVGRHDRIDATLRTDAETWLELVSGRVDGLAAFVRGRLRVEGDLHLAIRLETLFRPGAGANRFLRVVRTDVGGVDVESIVAGRGTPVLLIHGLAANKLSFVPTIDALSDGFEVHALDLPGFGMSDKPLPTPKRYSAAWFASVVRGYLRAHGMRSAYVVGNSMGGRVALELALRYPRRTAGVVGLGSAVAFDEWRWAAPFLRVMRGGGWVGAAPFPLRRAWVESGIADLFHDPGRIPADNIRAGADDLLRAIQDPRNRMAIVASARHLAAERGTGRRSFWGRLEELRTPSYWIWGDHDRLSSCRYAERVRQHATGARVEVWEDVGHVPQFEVPERTNASIRGFLEGLEARHP